MSFEPTPSQALLLFGLLARHGACKQAELMPAVLAKDREALAAAKLIAVEKIGRSFQLRLEDAGWDWTGGHLSAELPPAQLALSDILKRLGEHLAKSGKTLADLIGSKPEGVEKRPTPKAKPTVAPNVKPARKPKAEPKARAAPNPAAAPKAKAAPKPKPPTATALRKRIEQAYLDLTGGRKDESLSLVRLRDKLSDLARPTVDAGLGRILKSDKKATLIRQDDPRRISKADQEAAYSPAGEPFHILWIAS